MQRFWTRVSLFPRLGGRLHSTAITCLLQSSGLAHKAIGSTFVVAPFRVRSMETLASLAPRAVSVPVAMMNWDPLPPRETTSRQQRRRRRMEASSDSVQQQPLAEGTAGPTANSNRKPNRPGFNSYLKVILDDAAMDRLHGVAKRIESKVQELAANTIGPDKLGHEPPETGEQERENQDESTETYANETGAKTEKKKGKPSRSKKNQPPRFKARSRNSIHMTFFFGGEALCALPPNELVDWYDKIRGRLQQANFVLSLPMESCAGDQAQPSNSIDTDQEQSVVGERGTETDISDDYCFSVTDLRLFPPGRNNLIVAHLEAAPAWHELHKDIRDIAKNSDSLGLREVTDYSKEKWTAHITMGNIFGDRNAQTRNTFTEILRQVTCEVMEDRDQERVEAETFGTANAFLFKARTHGIAMGGPIPDQVEGLDWNFTYNLHQKPKSSGES